MVKSALRFDLNRDLTAFGIRFDGQRSDLTSCNLRFDSIPNKCSAVAEMDDRLATTDMGRKLGGCADTAESVMVSMPSSLDWNQSRNITSFHCADYTPDLDYRCSLSSGIPMIIRVFHAYLILCGEFLPENISPKYRWLQVLNVCVTTYIVVI